MGSDGNTVGNAGAIAFAKLLEEPGYPLRKLVLSGSGVGDQGVTALSLALAKNENLETLAIQSNLITDEGAKALAESLNENSQLKFLILTENSITDHGAKAMADAISNNPNSKLVVFDCQRNHGMSSKGLELISKALQQR